MVERTDTPSHLDLNTDDFQSTPIRFETAQIAQTADPAQGETPPANPRHIVVALEDGPALHLPEGTSIEQPRVNGTDLEFVQPDGTIFVVPEGAVVGLTIFIGNVEIPPLAVAALFETNAIEPAAGPEQSGTPQSSGGNFAITPGGIGDGGLGVSDLLGNMINAAGSTDNIEPAQANLPPQILGGLNASLSEEGLLLGLPDSLGDPDTTDASSISGRIQIFDPNPGDTLTVGFSIPTTPLSSGGTPIVWTLSGQTLAGTANGTTVITATIDNSGSYTITLSAPIDHPNGTIEDAVNLVIPVTVTDFQGLSATANLVVSIEDDSPIAFNGGTHDLQENADATGAFIPSSVTGTLPFDQGADGATVTAITYRFGDAVMDMDAPGGFPALQSNGIPVTITSATDAASGIITLTGTAGGAPIFTFTVSPDGTYQFELQGPIDHPDADQSGGDDELRMVFDFTITDNDGDTATSWIQIDIRDDAPTASNGGTHDLQENADATGAFIPSSVTGTLPFDGGADGATVTAITYRFGDAVMDMDAPGGFPALQSNGVPVTITSVTDAATGIITLTGTAGGAPIFTFTVSPDGAYQFDLQGPIDHPDAGQSGGDDELRMVFDFTVTDNDGDTATSWIQIDIRDDAPTASYSGTAVVQEIATDGVFDQSMAIGTLIFDAGADGGGVSKLVFRTALDQEDGVGVALKSNGQAIAVETSADGLTVTGSAGGRIIFTFEVTDPATGAYEFTLHGPIDHPDPGVDGSETGIHDYIRLVFDFTVTDKDGDSTGFNQGTIQVDILDDGPVVAGQSAVTVSESALDDPINWGSGDFLANLIDLLTGGTDSATGRLADAVDFGADGAHADASFVFTGNLDGLPQDLESGGKPVQYGALTINGETIVIGLTSDLSDSQFATFFDLAQKVLDGSANFLELIQAAGLVATADFNPVFSLRVDEHGDYTFRLFDPLDHSGGNSDDLTIDFSSLFKAMDADGDAVSLPGGAFTVTITDDTPMAGDANANQIAALDDDTIGIPFTGTLIHDGGADGLAFIQLTAPTLPAGFTHQLTADGTSITIFQEQDGSVVPVLEITLDPQTGAYTATQLAAVRHAEGDGENDLDLTLSYSVTDGDDDAADGAFIVRINDDLPTASGTSAIAVHESALDDPIDWNSGNLVDNLIDLLAGGTAGASGQLSDAVDFGADGAHADASFVFTGSLDGLRQDLISNGQPVQYASLDLGGETIVLGFTTDIGAAGLAAIFNSAQAILDGGLPSPADALTVFFTMLSNPDFDMVFSLRVDEHGDYTFRLFDELDHPGQGADDLVIDFSSLFNAVDADGDAIALPANAFTVAITDDLPLAGDAKANQIIALDDDDTASAATGTLIAEGGADGLASIQLIAPDLPDGFTHQLADDGTSITVFQNQDGSPVAVLQITLNAQTGAYAATQLAAIRHADGGGENDLDLTLAYSVTDGDDDTTEGAFTVRINDDVPAVIGDGKHNVGLDEDDIVAVPAVQPAGTDGDQSSVVTGQIGKVDFGADGFGSLAFSGGFAVPNEQSGTLEPGGEGIDSGLTSDERPVFFRMSGDGLVIEGYVPGVNGGADEIILTATLNGTDRGYQVELLGNIDHQPGNSGRGAAQSINFDVRATDGDGDFVDVGLSLRITDDAPVANHADRYINLNESDIDSGTASQARTFSIDFGADGYGETYFTGQMGFNIGGTTAGNITFNVDAGPVTVDDVTSNGKAITFERTDANTIRGFIVDDGGAEIDIIELKLNDTDTTVTATLLGKIDHLDVGSGDPLAMLRLDATVGFKDGDGDPVTSILRVNIHDDTPTASPSTTVWLDDEYLSGGIPGGIGDQTGTPTNATGFLNHNFGADAEEASISWLSTSVSHSGGLGFSFEVADGGATLRILQDGKLVVTATVNQQTGAYTVTQNAPIRHPAGDDENDVTFQLKYEVRDGDGDTAESHLWVKVDDDTPIIEGNGAAPNLLTNGDFSDGIWSDRAWGGVATDTVGWQITGTEPGQTGVQLEYVDDGYLGMSTPNGLPMVDLAASPGNVAISQTLSGLDPAGSYTLSFLIGSPQPGSAGLEAYWNGAKLDLTFDITADMTEIMVTGLVPDAEGKGVLTFKEVGSPDNTGTYLADVSLAPADATDLPVIEGQMGEAATVFDIAEGTHFQFGADGPGQVTFDTDAAVLSAPSGTSLGKPEISYDQATGKLTVNPGWGFTGLSLGEIATLTIPFSVMDADGDVKTGFYRVTITGADGALSSSPGFPEFGTITEYAETHPEAGSVTDRTWFDEGYNGGGFHIYDDHGDVHQVRVEPQGAQYLGYVTAEVSETTANDGAGVVTWRYHVSDADLNPLAEGETREEQFEIVVSDQHGNETTRTITVTLVGTNDTPVITVEDGSDDQVTEAGGIANADAGDPDASGKLSITDADAGQSHFADPDTGDLQGTYGKFTFDPATGNWTYTLDNDLEATQALRAGQIVTETLTVRSADGTQSHAITVTVTGTNDGPVAKDFVSPFTFFEDETYNLDFGAIPSELVSDVDTSMSHFTADAFEIGMVSIDGGPEMTAASAGITVDAAGNITIDTSVEAYQHLAQDQTVHVVVNFIVTDDGGLSDNGTVTFAVKGTNDVPVATNDTIHLGFGSGGGGAGHAATTPVIAEIGGQKNSWGNAQDIDRDDFRIAPNSGLTDDSLPSVTIQGELDDRPPAAANDKYKLELKAGERIVIDLDNVAGGLQPILRLYGSNHDQLAFSNSADPFIEFTATQTGVYYVEVNKPNKDQTGEYDLNISIDNFQAPGGTPQPITFAASTLLANDYDIDQDAIRVVEVNGTDVQFDEATGLITVAPGVTTFTYTIEDSAGARSSATVTVEAAQGVIKGDDGDNILIGGNGDDFLVGGAGDDILIGGLGNDTLTGGDGSDTFVFAEMGSDNFDTITDYVFGKDEIDISALLDGNFGAGDDINDFVQVTTDGMVRVDTSGSGYFATNGSADVALLEGIANGNVTILIDDDDYTVTI